MTSMAVSRCSLAAALATFACLLGASPVRAQEFPFGMELTLDAAPMPGSKRVPRLDIAENGKAQFDLWCKSVAGQFSVANDSVIFIPGQVQDNNCPPDRATADDNLLAALVDATNWKRQGDRVTFTGKQPLRFMLLTN